jgi:hypothetical protein
MRCEGELPTLVVALTLKATPHCAGGYLKSILWRRPQRGKVFMRMSGNSVRHNPRHVSRRLIDGLVHLW